MDFGAALLVTGDPGAGKTTYLRALAERADGARVLWAHGGAADYQALDQLLTPLHDELGPDDPLRIALGLAGGPEPALMRVSHATVALLRHAAERQPLLALIDAGEILDEKSARVLTFAARRLAGSRIAMIFAARAGSPHDLLLRAGLPEHRIEPLDAGAAARLIRERHPAVAGHVLERIVAEAGGNPGALLEHAAALTAGQLSGAEPVPSPLPVGEGVRARTAALLAGFPAPTREVLLLAALDETGDLTAVRAAAGGADVLAALAPAVERGYLRVDERARILRFGPVLPRAAVVGHAADPQTRRAHRALAAVWAHDPDRHLRHLAAAGGSTNAERAARLRTAAESAILRGGTGAAIESLTRAAELTPDAGLRARWTLEAACLRAGLDDDLAAAHRQLVAAIETYGKKLDPALAGALHTLAVTCWLSGDPAQWQAFERVTARCDPGPPVGLRIVAAGLGNPVALTAELLDEIDAAAARLDDEDPVTITRTALACIYADRLAACRVPLARVIDGGPAALASPATVPAGFDRWHSGQWDELLDLTASGTAGRDRAVLGSLRALVAVARGDAAPAELPGTAVGEQFANQVWALAAIGAGDHAEAYRQAAAISRAGTLAPYTPHALWVLFELVEGALGAGLRKEAEAHVEAMRRAGLAAVSPRLALVVGGCAAMVSDDPDAYAAAVAVPEAERWPFDLGRVHLAYGRHLRRHRRSAAARAQLASALEIFERLGARPWIRQAAGELRAEGGASGLLAEGALSPQERRIAELAAAGLTNKQIAAETGLSSRTVGNHLYRVFPKLGITSRAALRDALSSWWRRPS
ncbi:LuxR C-terminal-related transcriptional regulator [Actinoplanes sp. Pm04-4]|uniref:LuxR C-terminal-related transcriptional regulator n=1 Tax=Paractinoplanes pyxinae TaxID=2997416 RepID=A0ABT4AY39_9ACTN|nr:helix-turn-helix transcriptional regulator [Actinoplanes pyxinae]MCY1139130.1 LuxR C-terminal-related transcriptional regulator [Actinoplanes pyxinae]